MKRNYYLSIFCLILSLTASSVCAQTISGAYNTTINPYKQEQTQWCWAACARMIDYSYSTTTPPSQCTMVNKANAQCTVGSCCSTLNGSRKTACSSPSTSNFPNTMGSCNGSLAWLISHYAAANTYASGSKTYSTVSSNLSSKRMMVARWGWTSGGGHFVVIYGCYLFNSVGQVSYANPSSGAKVTESHTYFTSNSSRNWTHTITMNGGTARRLKSPQGISEVAEQLVQVYPNPTNGLVRIELLNESELDHRVSIVNMLGQEVELLNLSPAQKYVDLDFKSLYGSGTYFINIQSETGTSTERLIVH